MGWTVLTVSIKIGPIFVERFILYVAPSMRRSALQLLGGRMSLVWTCLNLCYGLPTYCDNLLFRYVFKMLGSSNFAGLTRRRLVLLVLRCQPCSLLHLALTQSSVVVANQVVCGALWYHVVVGQLKLCERCLSS